MIIGGLVLFANRYPSSSLNNGLEKNKTIKYKIGNIDPRFNLSVEEVKYLAHEATQIWTVGLNKTLFEYDDNAALVVNLIYDERQKNTEYVDQFNTKMDKKAESLDQFNKRLEQQQQSLKQREMSLDQEYSALKQEISIWSLSEFESGENRQRLSQIEDVLREKQKKLSGDWDAYHLNVSLYNKQVEDYNQYAKQGQLYNAKSPSKTFHKGTYSGKSIDIYQISGKNDLKVTLAHEFGHALGLSHHQDPTALMYPSVAQQDINNFILRPADIALYQQR